MGPLCGFFGIGRTKWVTRDMSWEALDSHFNKAVGQSIERGMCCTPPDRKGKRSSDDDDDTGDRWGPDPFASKGIHVGWSFSHHAARAIASDGHDKCDERKCDNIYESESERGLVHAFLRSHRNKVRHHGRQTKLCTMGHRLHADENCQTLPAPTHAAAIGPAGLSSPMVPSDDTFAHITLGRSAEGRYLNDTAQPDGGNGDGGNGDGGNGDGGSEDGWY